MLARLGLLALFSAEVAVAIVLRGQDAANGIQLANQVALAVTFLALCLADLRLAVAVCVLELIVGGGSGRWTVLPAGVSGRMLLNLILGLVSVGVLFMQARAGTMTLGRYTVHALVIAILIPAVWIPLGILSGNGAANAIADGDGFLFFGFALILAAAATRGNLGWLRRWILVCSLAVAVMTLAVATGLVVGAVSAVDVFNLLIRAFDMGGGIVLDEEELRVYLASGLFLQVGVAAVTWELLQDRRRSWAWAALVVLVVALLPTSTRGYWAGAIIAATVVVVLGRERVRVSVAARGRRHVWATVALGAGAFMAIALLGAGGGMGSNMVKVYQAALLTWHTLERPFLGWGLGAVMPDYRFSDHFVYEITYLDRALKLGLIGLALFLSLPLRLLRDSWRVLNASLPGAVGMPAQEAVVALAILTSVLVVSATNPYMAGSVGIGAVVLTIAWLDPFLPRQPTQPAGPAGPAGPAESAESAG